MPGVREVSQAGATKNYPEKHLSGLGNEAITALS